MIVLPDTSIWVEYLRRGRTGTAWGLDELLEGGEVIVCGPVVVELLAGAGPPQRAQLWQLLSALRWAEIARGQWRRVGEVAAALRIQGASVALTDIEIAVAAAEVRAALWTTDSDFDRIAEVIEDLRLYRP